MNEGVDIIFPVAGPVGFGTAEAVQEWGNAFVIGVDSDWVLTAPEYSEITLTSVVINVDVGILAIAQQIVDGTFAGGTYYGTLENNGVGLAPFHNLDWLVSDELKDQLGQIEEAIIAGDINTLP